MLEVIRNVRKHPIDRVQKGRWDITIYGKLELKKKNLININEKLK